MDQRDRVIGIGCLIALVIVYIMSNDYMNEQARECQETGGMYAKVRGDILYKCHQPVKFWRNHG